jgi:ribosome biogenesis GTPase A
MHRAHKRLARELANIDVVLELRDARLPVASCNPELERLIGARRRVLLFNKAGLADPALTRRWEAHFRERSEGVLFLDAERGRGINLIYPRVAALVAATVEKLRRRGIRPPPQRLMVVGIPNVGKSTLINRMARGRKRETAPFPGVTKGVSWVHLKGRYLLMDTPGLILPRLEDTQETLQLGWIAAFRDTVLGEERLAVTLLGFLLARANCDLGGFYRLADSPPEEPSALLEAIGRRRGLLRRGATVDMTLAARAVLTDFRAGHLGHFTLEEPP